MIYTSKLLNSFPPNTSHLFYEHMYRPLGCRICNSHKGQSCCKQCLHHLHFMKTKTSSPNLQKLARADISCQFMKTKILVQNCLQNEWTLLISFQYLFFHIFQYNVSWASNLSSFGCQPQQSMELLIQQSHQSTLCTTYRVDCQ